MKTRAFNAVWGFATGEMGFGIKLHSSKFEPLMSALGQKQTSAHVRGMSALPPKADIGTGTRVSPSTHQPRQLGDVRRDPAGLVVGEQFRRRSPLRLILEIDIREHLAVVVAHDLYKSRRERPAFERGHNG